jgi:hypothetical protein
MLCCGAGLTDAACTAAARLTRARSKDMEKEAAAAATAQAAAEAKPGRVQPPSLKDAICTRAARFKQQHFSETSRLAGLETAGLKQLKRLCADLGSSPAAAQELIDALTSSSISVFELLSSGAVQRLNDYLMGRDLAADAKDRDSELLQRLAAFVELVLAPGTASSPPLLALVRKLLTALGSVEAFPVVCSPAAAVGSASSRSLGRSFSAGSYTGNTLSNGLAALMNPFKIRLEKHVQEKGLREYSSHYVLIEPLASLSAVEDFLWSKVSRGMSVPELEKLNAAEAGGAAGATAACTSAAAAAGAAQPGSASGQASGAAAAAAAKPAATATAPVPTGRQARSGSREQPIPESSAAQPIPEEPAGRRMTRAAAARAMAQARTHAHDAGDADAGAPASGDGMSEEPDVMLYEDEGHRGDEGGPSGGADDMSEDGKELDEGAEEGDGAGEIRHIWACLHEPPCLPSCLLTTSVDCPGLAQQQCIPSVQVAAADIMLPLLLLAQVAATPMASTTTTMMRRSMMIWQMARIWTWAPCLCMTCCWAGLAPPVQEARRHQQAQQQMHQQHPLQQRAQQRRGHQQQQQQQTLLRAATQPLAQLRLVPPVGQPALHGARAATAASRQRLRCSSSSSPDCSST